MTGRLREQIGFEFKKFDSERENSKLGGVDEVLRSNRSEKGSEPVQTQESKNHEKTKKAA
jgi:hypothetical protein